MLENSEALQNDICLFIGVIIFILMPFIYEYRYKMEKGLLDPKKNFFQNFFIL